MISEDPNHTEAQPPHSPKKEGGWLSRAFSPFRVALLRGLGVVLPPLLTIILFFWAWNTIDRAVIKPTLSVATNVLSWSIDKSVSNDEVETALDSADGSLMTDIDGEAVFIDGSGNAYQQFGNDWVPEEVAEYVIANPPEEPATSGAAAYSHYASHRFVNNRLIIPAVLALFVGFLYLTGKLLAAGVGRFVVRSVESLINRLPIIRNVYSAVKQVTDFAFSEHEVQFSRVVAVEYPRKGIWSMGFVTSESLAEIRDAAGEPMLSVLMPTSPMPATGFTISVPKSETIDLNISIDQAIQFCVSCGVVVPPHQLARNTIDGQVRSPNGSNSNGSADDSSQAVTVSPGVSTAENDDTPEEQADSPSDDSPAGGEVE
ncbi:MAG: DUF502 domain-containing protein [Planctomycetota bacterium]